MADKKDRYWENLDISHEWKNILNSMDEKFTKDSSRYQNKTRSLEKMTEELLSHLLQNADSDMDDNSSKIARLNYAVKCLTDRKQLALKLYFFQNIRRRKKYIKVTQAKRTVKRLSSKQRVALKQRFYKNLKQRKKHAKKYSQEKIAQIMGCSQQNVSKLVLRALKQVLKRLTK